MLESERKKKRKKTSQSNLNRIFRANRRVSNECENMNVEINRNNTNYVLNDNRNKITKEENTAQKESIVLDSRTCRELNYKGKLEETKREDQQEHAARTKTEQMIKAIEKMSIDMIMFNETNCKWNTRTIENRETS